MIEVVIFIFVVGWFARVVAEDAYAAIKGITSPRITRQKDRYELAQQANQLTIRQAASARIAHVLTPRPGATPLLHRHHPALEYMRARWNDAWTELLYSHNEEVAKRAAIRQRRKARDEKWRQNEQQQQEARRRARAQREADRDDDVHVAELVEDNALTRPQCSCKAPAVYDGLCPDCLTLPPQIVTCELCGTRHWDSGPCPIPTVRGVFGSACRPEGWREITSGATRDRGDHHEDQDGDAWYRQWETPHPSGDGVLRTTYTAWAQDNGEQRWIVIATSWDWIGADPSDVRFEAGAESDARAPGPSGQPWPTADHVRRDVEAIIQPPDPDETPLVDVLGASMTPDPE